MGHPRGPHYALRHNWGPAGSPFVSEGFKGGTRGAPIMSRDVSLSDSKCWNLVAKTQRWAQMGNIFTVIIMYSFSLIFMYSFSLVGISWDFSSAVFFPLIFLCFL